KPADRPGTNAREHGSSFVRLYEKSTDTPSPPKAHHQEGVSAAYVDNIRGQDLLPNFPSGRLFLDEKEDVGSTFQEPAEIFLDVLPIPLGIQTRRGNKKKLVILLVREPNNLSINPRSSLCSYVPSADRDNGL
ncbi:MAG TPA: hypothetical protein VHM88_24090, partial [Candidatus Acidoferrales bacterium]|nr:hypothetical protein [Candidatus Acidoferrales bacterium]